MATINSRRVHPATTATAAVIPATVLALYAALTAQEQEVLAYLLSGDGRWSEQSQRRQHSPELRCGCFQCYKSFWERWDASPNRQVIHRIIDAVEESEQRGAGGRRRRRRGGQKVRDFEPAAPQLPETMGTQGMIVGFDGGHVADGVNLDGHVACDDDDDCDEVKSSSMRRLVRYIGERVLGVWN